MFLFQFAHEHLDFRIAELKSVANIFDIKLTIREDYNVKVPFLVLNLPSVECAHKLASRAVLVRSVYELWAEAPTYSELHQQLQGLPRTFTNTYLNPGSSMRILVDAFNRQLTQAQKIQRIESILESLEFSGKVNLKSPDHSLHLLEHYDPVGSGGSQDADLKHVYFARWLSDGQRRCITQYDLKTRNFIGNTSMDACLSLIMANQAQIQGGHLVFDPFVGTGSVLVAAAHHGAYVMGTDMDYNLLNGIGFSSRQGQKYRQCDESIRSNLQQYGLGSRYIDALVADSSRHAIIRDGVKFDVIITDPPYGIREPTRKVGSKVTGEGQDGNQEVPNQSSSKASSYHISQIYKDLLNFAARYLRVGGRLVFWLPVYRAHYEEHNIPRHPLLELTYNSEQIFSVKCSRRLITMTKTHPSRDETVLNGATLYSDPYANDSFREKYFFWSQDTEDFPAAQNVVISRKKQKKMAYKRSRQEREVLGKMAQVNIGDQTEVQPNRNQAEVIGDGNQAVLTVCGDQPENKHNISETYVCSDEGGESNVNTTQACLSNTVNRDLGDKSSHRTDSSSGS